jgi:hypothetical protein
LTIQAGRFVWAENEGRDAARDSGTGGLTGIHPTLDHPVVGRYRTMTKPVKFSDTPGPAPTASPTFGQHSDEILSTHGYSAAEIASFRERGVVR